MNTIRVVLIDDEPFWQENISRYIDREEDIRVVRIFDNKTDAISEMGKIDCDVVLLDLNLTRANLDGIEVIGELSHAGCKVIALTAISEEEVIIETFESGAVNYINKSSLTDIIRAIREAHSGKVYIHPDGAEVLRKELIKERSLNKILTPAEREVYGLLMKGLSKSQMAEQLNKSISTIKKQVRCVKDKLKDHKISF